MDIESTISLRYASLKLIRDTNIRASLLDMLSPNEQARYEEFSSINQADQYLLGRAMLRYTLTQHAPEVMPNEWIVVADEYGKPQILGPISDLKWKFNISHSEELVILAFSEKVDVGVDVEFIYRPAFGLTMAKHYFASSEFAFIQALPEEKQAESIAQFWTLKESYLKAFGLGVRVPLKDLVFTHEGGNGLIFHLTGTAKKILRFTSRYNIKMYGLGSEYVVALTHEVPANSNEPAVDVSEWVPQDYMGPNVLATLELKRKTLELDGCETE